ncbi:CAAX amino protease [Capnocytophaga sp. HP1101]
MIESYENKQKKLRNVLLFSLVAIGCGWAGIGVNQLLGEPSNLESLGSGIFIATPMLCMILLRLFGGDGWRDFPLKPRFKQNTRWYLFAIAVYPIVVGTTLLIGKLLGWVDMSKFSVGACLPVLMVAFLPSFIKNIFEESAFRGYLTVKMEQLTENEWVVYLVVAVVAQIWHLPYNLVFLDDAYQATFFPYSKGLFVLVSLAVIAVWTIMYTEIFFLSRSLLLVVLLHTMKDVFNPLISEGFVVISPDKTLLVSPLFGLIPTLMYLAIGLYLRRVRKKNIIK